MTRRSARSRAGRRPAAPGSAPFGSLARRLPERAFVVHLRAPSTTRSRETITRGGVVNTDSLHAMMTGSGLMSKRTEDLGYTFLAFIAAPLEAAAR